MVLLQIVLGTFPPNHTLIDDLRDSELYLDGYDMYREDKKPGKGGGILIYVKDTVTSTPWSWSMLRLAVVVGWRVTDDRS